jgi:hypothetical protein
MRRVQKYSLGFELSVQNCQLINIMLPGFKLETITGFINIFEKFRVFFVGKAYGHNSARMIALQRYKQGVLVMLCFGQIKQVKQV